ncbi:NifU family protein [Reichenbachiella sp. MALMAid0571]|uniref:NifU family protein n=1 Tax=Reichenbachiella sp. MALMAid0571 TaxID=3143939 RepID=UPI0032E01B0D
MESQTSKIPFNIYFESNPNPNSLKFVANSMLLPAGEYYDYQNIESASNSELAQELFTYPFVNGVFFMSNFVTVSKEENVEWEEVKEGLKQHIKDYLESGKSVVKEHIKPEVVQATQDSDIVTNIKNVLDEYIKPAVESDGGAIAFESFEEGTVKVVLQGSCSGCPSSTLTLKAGIENLLKRMIPEVENVEAVNG